MLQISSLELNVLYSPFEQAKEEAHSHLEQHPDHLQTELFVDMDATHQIGCHGFISFAIHLRRRTDM